MNTSPEGNAAAPKRERAPYDRETVLAIAVALFNERGYEATSMGILAEKLGISKTAIYHHVDSKEQLFELALDIALGSLETVLTRIENSHGGPQEKLEYAIRGSIQVVCYKLQFVTLLLRVRGNTDIEHGRVATTSTARSPQ